MRNDDLDALFQVLGDAEAMAFYPAPFTAVQTQAWIDWNLRSYTAMDCGRSCTRKPERSSATAA